MDPDARSVSPSVAIFWQYARAQRLGNCNSYTSWGAALKWFFREVLYLKRRKLRLPLLLRWIVQYLDGKGVSPSTWNTVDLDTLMESLLLLLLFFSISRPSELVFTDKTEDIELEIIRTGLRWSDVSFHNQNCAYTRQYMQLTIPWYKNQVFYGEPKLIYMAPPICTDTTHHCHKMDFFMMFQVYKRRRTALYAKRRTDFERKCKKLSTSKRQKQQKYLWNLRPDGDAFVFVYSNGKIVRPTDLASLMKKFAKEIGMKNPNAYPSYSIRIGAVSLCAAQNIDPLKLLRYVIWSIKSLPHVAGGYVSYDIPKLRIIPFEMIHGRNGKTCIDLSGNPLAIVSVWDNAKTHVLWE
eukprot:223625_1